MKLLLDTHVLLWWQTDDPRLNREARRAIAGADVVWVSAASAWEASIKSARGRLRLDERFRLLASADDFTPLPVLLEHAERVAELLPHHSDPFDRLLIAQALTENATIVTHDHAFSPYGVRILWT